MPLPPRRARLGTAVAVALTAGALCATAIAPAATAAPQPRAAAPNAPAAPATPTASTAQNGSIVLIGGAIKPGEANSEAIIQRIVDLAKQHAGDKKPRIAIVTTASEVAPNATEAADGNTYDNATANGLYYSDWFAAHGADVYAVPVDVNPGEDYPGDPYSADNAKNAAVAQEVRDSDAVYFGGGDQINYVRAFMDCTAPDQAAADIYAFTSCTDTPVMAAIREVVESGGVTAGTSAGLTIQQGADMISGGDPYPSWRDGATVGWFEDNRLASIPSGGFGFFTEGMLDSHFARRDRQPRIVRLAIATGHDRSFGVEEKTALVVDRAARTGEVIGQLGASLLDTSAATSDGRNAAGVRYSYFTTGSTIDFATGAITLAGTAHSGAGSAEAPAAPTDIWGSYECEGGIFGTLDLAQGLVKSSASTATGDTCDSPAESPRFRTTFTRTADTRWNDDGGFTDLAMSITGIPSFSAAARATGSTGTTNPQVPAGSQAGITVTVTNTGSTPLTGFRIASDASVSSAAAASDPASNAVVAPGGTLQLQTTRTVAKGSQTFALRIIATAVDANGAELGVATAPQTASITFVGVGSGAEASANAGANANGSSDSGGSSSDAKGSATGSTSAGANGAADGTGAGAKGQGSLAQTGTPADGLALPAAGILLLAGAAALIARARLRARA